VVTDPAGNFSTSNAIEVVVDNTAPSAGTQRYSSRTNSGHTQSPSIATGCTFNLSLAGNADANGTSVAYEVSTDGGTSWSSTTATQTTLLSYATLFRSVVTDPAGNFSTSNAIEVVVDNTAPSAG